MNNNWTFNNYKQNDDEDNESTIESISENVTEEINEPVVNDHTNDSFQSNSKLVNKFNNLDNNRKSALFKLLIGLGFFIAIIIFTKFSGNSLNNVDSSTTTTTILPSSNVDKTMLNKINKNIYIFNYSLKYISNKKENTVNYKGLVKDNETIILKTVNSDTKKYYINEKKYYLIETEKNLEINEEVVFDNFNSKYFNLNDIYSYIEKGTLEWETIYKDKSTIRNYSVYLKDIILTSNNDDYISITIDNREVDMLKIDVDYSKLFSNLYENVESVNLNMVFELVNEKNIESVEKDFS